MIKNNYYNQKLNIIMIMMLIYLFLQLTHYEALPLTLNTCILGTLGIEIGSLFH